MLPDYLKWAHHSPLDQLSEHDKQLIKALAKAEDAAIFETLFYDPKLRRQLLDNPALADAILRSPVPLPISSELYFYVLMRKALLGQSIENFELTDYLASLLCHMASETAAFQNSASQGKTFFYASDCLNAINATESPNERFYQRVALGNQSLFLTGLFEEHVRFRERRRGAPSLEFFEQIGQSQFARASENRLAKDLSLQLPLKQLSIHFRPIRNALTTIGDRFTSLGEGFL